MSPQIGERVEDLFAGGFGTIVGMRGRYYEVEWDDPGPYPSFIKPSDGFWRFESDRGGIEVHDGD